MPKIVFIEPHIDMCILEVDITNDLTLFWTHNQNFNENVIFSIKTNVVTLLNSYLIRIVCVRTVKVPT